MIDDETETNLHTRINLVWGDDDLAAFILYPKGRVMRRLGSVKAGVMEGEHLVSRAHAERRTPIILVDDDWLDGWDSMDLTDANLNDLLDGCVIFTEHHEEKGAMVRQDEVILVGAW